MNYLPMIMGASLTLMACQPQNTTQQQAASATQTVASSPQTASAPNSIESLARVAKQFSGNTKDRYLNSCVDSALQNQIRNEQSVKIAADVCQCAYDSGVKAYGDTTLFETAVKNALDHPERIDEKLLNTTDQSINSCLDAIAPKQAVASDTAKTK